MIWTRLWKHAFRSVSPSLFLMGTMLGPLACESSAPSEPPPTGDPQSPSIISFGTNVLEITDGESVRFVALVTDPGGADNLIGGQLTSADGAIKYGAFSASQQGAYSLDLTWAQFDQAQRLGFATEDKRTFLATFYNATGQSSQKSVEVRFHCRGTPACEGRCTNNGSQCALSTDKLCIAGTCQAGCYVSGEFVAADGMSSANACNVCKPAMSRTMLQTLPNYASCKPGLACGDGLCEVPFFRQNTGTTSSLSSVAAPTALFQIAVGSLGAAVRTLDGGATWSGVSPGSDSLRSVFALNATEIFTVGMSGSIYASSDGGSSWAKQTSPASNTLTGVWASGSNDVWITGTMGTVLHSTNGGTTWTKLTIPTPTTAMNAVWGSGANDVYFVGDSGTILRTTDGGASFTALTSTVSASLTGVWGSAADNVYIVGNSSTVLRTTNSGTSFTKLGTPTASESLTGVWGSAADNVYVVGGFGLVWRSMNGGALVKVPTVSSSSFTGISGSAANAFTIVGSSTVLRKL